MTCKCGEEPDWHTGPPEMAIARIGPPAVGFAARLAEVPKTGLLGTASLSGRVSLDERYAAAAGILLQVGLMCSYKSLRPDCTVRGTYLVVR